MDASSSVRSKWISTRRVFLGGGLAAVVLGAGSAAHQAWLLQRDEAQAEEARILLKHRSLPAIPLYDARRSGLAGLAQDQLKQLLELRQSCIGSLTPALTMGLEGADRLALNWLRRSQSPYLGELDAIANIAGVPGIYLLNASYEWGCTALAAPSPDHVSARLLRTLDWPFDGLGRLVEVVRQSGSAGEFLNVTWPGAVGVLTAMAPGRFAASINQAPAREGQAESSGGMFGVLHNSLLTFEHSNAWPALHLLRRVFEQAKTFADARSMLEQTPISAPAIFTLVGIAAHETCVIERTETEHATHIGISSAANGWRYGHFSGNWAGARDADARGDNQGRRRAIERYAGRSSSHFAWVAEPILNSITRLAVEADPARGLLSVRGYEETPDDDQPHEAGPATADLHLKWPLEV